MDKGPRLLLVHGSVVNGEVTWAAQRPLAERFDLVVPNRRGFPPGPDVDRVDFTDEAVWLEQYLEPGTHLVGHSYGGVIALLAAARRPELVCSLTVIEPPAFALVRGNAAVDEFVAGGERLWHHGPRDPEAFLRVFLRSVGTPIPPGRLTPALLHGARTLMVERPPWEAEVEIPPVPLLGVSGGHSAAFDAVLDALGGERLTLTGAGHSPQRLGAPFNDRLAEFVMKQNGP